MKLIEFTRRGYEQITSFTIVDQISTKSRHPLPPRSPLPYFVPYECTLPLLYSPVLLNPNPLLITPRPRRHQSTYFPQITTRLLDAILPLISPILNMRFQNGINFGEETRGGFKCAEFAGDVLDSAGRC
jgi:hypothetical protein